MNKMSFIFGMFALSAFSGVAVAGNQNPCNPCAATMSANPCSPATANNPCAVQKAPNPCSLGQVKNPCAMPMAVNPCGSAAGDKKTPIRPRAFNSTKQAIAMGRKMWNDESLGTSGVACLSCHADHELLNLDKGERFPHFVKMVGDVVTLDQMINYCMLNPMKGKQLDANSKEMTAMAAFFQEYRSQYRLE